MIIHQNFTGGNIKVVRMEGDDVYLDNELRDTQGDWFYWAFCVEGAQGKTLTFHFPVDRLGYFGPAVSHDLKSWRWQKDMDGFAVETAFTYAFGGREEKVYFAHDMLYHPDRFLRFAKENGLTVEEFCKSRKGRCVPCVKIGEGSRSVILTSRHHACEATGNYVLEGVLLELLKNPVPDTKILCVPFVDYDGVVDGDQGKNRFPHDHNRDYSLNESPIYAATAKIQAYAKENGCRYAFDFHSPWHYSGVNDCAFIVQNSFEKLDRLNTFGELFEQENTASAFEYFHKNDMPFMTGWNRKSSNFGAFASDRDDNELAFSLETPYFGTQDNAVSQENLVELGRCFGRAFRRYAQEKEGSLPLKK